ncbi:hypothetical protein [Pseudomonas sp. YuFO8]|uniref:hypothetical protein n=1 Tax=Pseudomonas sp. YuFO8 TaxID=3095361 RepID=UPI002B2426D3|nr:hypothetical protein [Pseudomonas sp. YuFO8]MEB2621361.1 hypothetical protein [Pseudomonas sp. YuFO8]
MGKRHKVKADGVESGDLHPGRCGNVDPQQVMALLNTWLEGQQGFVRPGGKETSYAYTFPHLGHQGFISGLRYYPGVVLVLEERFRAAKLLDGEN